LFLPLVDDNPLRHVRRPYVTWALIAVNCLVHAVSLLLGWSGEADGATLAAMFGMTPAVLDGVARSALMVPPAPLTLATYPFIHADLLHLFGNMLFLRAFGDNVEDAFGHVRFLLFYLIAGAFAGLAHAAVHPQSESPLIGASGAVAAIVAAYVVLHPRVLLWVLAFGRVPIRVPAWMAIGLWIVFQLYNVWVQPEDDVAWFAHVGGLVTGFVLVLVFRRPGVGLFDRGVALNLESASDGAPGGPYGGTHGGAHGGPHGGAAGGARDGGGDPRRG
jgi:membrane associated rhomboid family serine protease